MTANDVEPELRGLSQVEARQRLATYGPNALPEANPIGLWQRLLSQFKSALIYILLFALALDLALWLYEGAKVVPFESIAIALVLVINAGLGAYQESKAEEALARLEGARHAIRMDQARRSAGADPSERAGSGRHRPHRGR